MNANNRAVLRLRNLHYAACLCHLSVRRLDVDWTPPEISLMHRQGISWAEIGELVGQRSRAVTADTYSHALVDSREIDRAALLNA